MTRPASSGLTPDIQIPDIRVTVKVQHVPGYSTPLKQAFQYTITIENCADESWQLLARHWEIADGTGQTMVVDGEGVVGEQPVLAPGSSYTYDSFVTVEALPGRMHGHYLLRDAWGVQARVAIPMFWLRLDEQAPPILN